MARVSDFKIEDLISYLQGSCNTIQDGLPDDMYEEDLTVDELNHLYLEIFLCDECGWWYEVGLHEEDNVCDDCLENQE